MLTLDNTVICSRVAVQPPYFAFSALELGEDETIHGSFVPEQPNGFENGPVTAAELGRHLAILGACAASTSSDAVRSFHLATRAHYIRVSDPIDAAPGQTLRASAKVVQQGRRDLTVDAAVFGTNKLATLKVQYQVLTETVFTRLFQQFRSPTPSFPASPSPYATLLPLRFDPPGLGQALAHSDAIPSSACAGHFPDYPAWPVALMMHCLGRVCTRLLHHVAQQPLNYVFMDVQMHADVLAFASQPLTFGASIDPSRPMTHPDYAFLCQATHGDTVIARSAVHIRATAAR